MGMSHTVKVGIEITRGTTDREAMLAPLVTTYRAPIKPMQTNQTVKYKNTK